MVQTVNSGVTAVNLTGTQLGPFDTNWPYETAAEVGVWLEANGLETRLTLTEDFTVAGATPLTNGGTVSLNGEQLPVSGWGNGTTGTVYRLIIRRETALSQGRQLTNSERVPLDGMERGLDKLARTVQDHNSVFIRTLTVPEGEIGPNIPRLAVRTGEGTRDAVTLAGFDQYGNVVADRTMGSFDADVAATLANREASDNNRELAEQAYANTNQLFANFGVASSLVEAATEAARDETLALKEAAEAVYDNTQQFYNENIGPLTDRVAALEANLTILSFTATPSVAEVGSSVTPVLNWTLSANPYSQIINNGVNAVTPVTARTANAAAAVTANTTWTLTVSDFFKTKTETAAISFRRKRYFGVTTKSPGVALTNVEVLALSGEFDTDVARASMTFDATGGRYPVICWPVAWGLPGAVVVGGLSFTDYTVETQDVTNASGSTVSYYILRFNGIQTGAAIGVTIQ